MGVWQSSEPSVQLENAVGIGVEFMAMWQCKKCGYVVTGEAVEKSKAAEIARNRRGHKQ